MSVIFSCVAGADVFGVTLTLRSGDALDVASYTGTPTLAGKVWPGGARPTAFAPTLAWIDPTAGTIAYSHTGAQTVGLDGIYKFLLSVTTGAGTDEFLVGDIDIEGGPDETGAEPRAYVVENDLSRLAPYISELQGATDETGFTEQRVKASRWLDKVLVSRRRRDLEEQRVLHWAAEELDPIAPTSGVDLGPAWGRSSLPDTTLQADLDAFQAALDDDGLIVTEDIADIVARYALYLILSPQVAETKDGTPYQMLAERFRGEANRMLVACVARVVDTVAAVTYSMEA